MQRVLWDIYEAALLLDTCLKIETKPLNKEFFLKELSDMLRKRALLKGLDVDDVFRNYNGMKRQYSLFIYLLTKGKKGFAGHNSKKFVDIIEIYKNDQNQYKKILKQAYREAGNRCNKEAEKDE